MRSSYYFSVLRYVHDAVTQEFVNVGVAVYAPERGFAGARVNAYYSRLTKMFVGIDGERYRQLVRYIESAIQQEARRLFNRLPLDLPQMDAWLARVLPRDDSALQFSPPAVGVAEDPERALDALYQRYVETYARAADGARRDDKQVWRVYRAPLERRALMPRLQAKEIAGKDLTHEFPQAWRNGMWHVCEAVSFDLLEAQSIAEKAVRWRGRLEELRDGSERFIAHLLLGAPGETSLRGAYAKAENILRKAGGGVELVREDEAEEFAEEVARDLDYGMSPRRNG